MIKIVNVKSYKKGDLIYIGRGCYGYKESVLCNQFKIGKDGDRDEVIWKYKRWIWKEYKKGGIVKDEVDKLVVRERRGELIVLGCWCFPESCHGDIIKKLVEYLV